MSGAFDPSLEIIIEGWGGKQGWHFPTWKVRWFVLQKKACPPDSDEVADARDYFKNSSDTFERAHNFNAQTDKKNLVLSYFTDETKSDLKEVFHFDENTAWTHETPRITTPKYCQAHIHAVHLYCKGSQGSSKLIFIPFWGFVEPNFKMMCQPWLLSFEFGTPKCYDHDDRSYFGDLIVVKEDVFGRTSKDLEKKLITFRAIFDDDLIFKEYKENAMKGLKLLLPIKFFGKNAQEDNKGADQEAAARLNEEQTKYQMRFTKRAKDLLVEKDSVGGREAWLVLLTEARKRSVTFETWMKIKDDASNPINMPLQMRTPAVQLPYGAQSTVRGITADDLAALILKNPAVVRCVDVRDVGTYAVAKVIGAVNMFWGHWERKNYALQSAEHIFPRENCLPHNLHLPQLAQVVFYAANAEDQARAEKTARMFAENIGTLNAFYRVLPTEILVLVGGFEAYGNKFTGNDKLVHVKR